VADPTRLVAPAKLTVELRLTGVRDDGYHLIDAEMVSLDLHDVLTVDAGDSLTASGPFAEGMPLDDSNLVRKALRLAGRTAAVHIEKLIPHGGGLGGGSADAAAVLRWCGYEDMVAASRLGADIPFCLRGGRARVTGIGEVLEPLPHEERIMTLIIPPFGVSTPAVFRRWDELGGPIGDHRNDLEPAAVDVEPRLAGWRDRISATLGVRPVLAGSGATWFVEGDHVAAARALTEATVVVTRTAPAHAGGGFTPKLPPRPR
jgi:4-diphosphocytidyl-2-C-methyl-D-erythritol kinase